MSERTLSDRFNATSGPGALDAEFGELSATQHASFRQDGFLALKAMASQADIMRVRELYDGFFKERRGWETGDFFETAGDFEDALPSLPQMNWLSRYEPTLLLSSVHRNALNVARQILGPTAELVWEFAMMKPPHVGAATPMHQDQAFFTKETDYHTAVSVWFPLQNVDHENGCMAYQPGSHLGPLHPHRSIGGDPRAHGLEAVLADDPIFQTVPLHSGDAVIHHSRTVHRAGPNLSNAPRRAYILEFAVRSKRELLVTDYVWNSAKRTERERRYKSALGRSHIMTSRLRWLKRRAERQLLLHYARLREP